MCIAGQETVQPHLFIMGESIQLVTCLNATLAFPQTGVVIHMALTVVRSWSFSDWCLTRANGPTPLCQESYPSTPPIWFVDSDDPSLAQVLERLEDVRKGSTLVSGPTGPTCCGSWCFIQSEAL